MIKHDPKWDEQKPRFIHLPDYPFTAQELLGDLRTRLESVTGRAIGLEELGQIMGAPKSTAHYWFSVYHHPHLIAFMALLERLPLQERIDYVGAHCRVFPTIFDPIFATATQQLQGVLDQRTGLTLITGSSGQNRSLLITALGHSAGRGAKAPVGLMGIDAHRPRHFVPVPALRYIDAGFGPSHVRELALSVWARILTSPARLMFLNEIWSAVPQITQDLIRLSATKHIIVAESLAATRLLQERNPRVSMNVLRISTRGGRGIKINYTGQ